ncbi:MAG: EAL domain-containing protein [Terricaulis sp.]
MSPAENTRQYKRDLRRLMTSVTVAIASFGVMLLAIIAYAGWSANTSAVEREQQLVANALNRSITRALNEQKSVAWWDQAVTNITDRRIDFDFVDANFGYFLTDTYAHDEVYILNGAGAPVYAFFEEARQTPAVFQRRAADLAPLLAEVIGPGPATLQSRPGVFAQGDYRFLAGGGTGAKWGGHILSIDGKAAVVAAMTIVPNVDTALAPASPHVLVSVSYIDEGFLARLGQSLLLPDLSLRPTAADENGLVSQSFVADDGVRLGELTWTAKRPGDVLLNVILPLVALGILLAGGLAIHILMRLKRASAELAQREASTRHQAKHDMLSGLPNRTYFLEQLDTLLASRGPDGAPLHAIVAYIDIDRFKDINDTLGHDVGDRLITSVAARLQSNLRAGDFLARFGGDEFAILCENAGADEVAALSQWVARTFAEPFLEGGGAIRVTTSVGVALTPENGDTSEILMRHADIALYEAKANGRDCAVLFTPEMAKTVETRRKVELDLRAALESGKLDVHYQTIVSAGTGQVTGVEALVRWRHEVRGDIAPALFIPIAEESGLMPAIGEWVLRRVFEDAARWPGIEVAVNLSPVQFRQSSLPALLERLVAEYGVSSERIVLEITEGVLLDSSDRTQAILDTVRSMGFKTALDDFGAGYSSLAHLCNYKFDKIKIDRSFVSETIKKEAARSIVQAVVKLGRGLGMDIVAEGVETEIDAIQMRQFGCNELQGFFFSRPMPRAGIDAVLRDRTSDPSEKATWLKVAANV